MRRGQIHRQDNQIHGDQHYKYLTLTGEVQQMGKLIQRNIYIVAQKPRSDVIVLKSQIRVKVVHKLRINRFFNGNRMFK